MQPYGGVSYLQGQLHRNKLRYVILTKREEWPNSEVNIGISTLHSAKGLEFDHVFILGMNQEFTPYGEGDDNDKLLTLRRLFAMGICRARETVTIGYKPGEASGLLNYLDDSTYEDISL